MNRHYRVHQNSSSSSVICPTPVHAPKHNLLEGYGSYPHHRTHSPHDAPSAAARGYSPGFLDDRVMTPYPEFMCHSPFFGQAPSPMPRLTPSPAPAPPLPPAALPQHYHSSSQRLSVHVRGASQSAGPPPVPPNYSHPDRMMNKSAHGESVSYNQLNPHLQGALNSLHKPFAHPYAPAPEPSNPQSSSSGDPLSSSYLSKRRASEDYRSSGNQRYGSYQQYYAHPSSYPYRTDSGMKLRSRVTARYPSSYNAPSGYYADPMQNQPLPASSQAQQSAVSVSLPLDLQTSTKQEVLSPTDANATGAAALLQASPTRRVIHLDQSAPAPKPLPTQVDRAPLTDLVTGGASGGGNNNNKGNTANNPLPLSPRTASVKVLEEAVSNSSSPSKAANYPGSATQLQPEVVSDKKTHAVPDEQDSLVAAIPPAAGESPSSSSAQVPTAPRVSSALTLSTTGPGALPSRKRPLPSSAANSPLNRLVSGARKTMFGGKTSTGTDLKTSPSAPTIRPSALLEKPGGANMTKGVMSTGEKKGAVQDVPTTSIIPKKEPSDRSSDQEQSAPPPKWHKARHREYSKAWRQKKKQEENTLKEEIEQLRKFRTMVEDAPEMMSLISLDPGHPIIFANSAFDRLVRIHGTDLNGQPYINIVHHMDQRALSQTLDQMCLLTDLPSVTYRIVNVDLGHVFLVESNFRRVSEGLIVVSTIRDKWYTGSQMLQNMPPL
mmetsp:Transcript_30782/g.39729  ORF Transcript_30782/g.39729 Transcript_30782/m.39729 type:complete len:717 (-) Transcript_30782:87-2237(-)